MTYGKLFVSTLLLVAAGCSAPKEDGSEKALLNCMSAIQTGSGDPVATKVPYAKDWGTAGEHYFSWPAGSGLVVAGSKRPREADSASCVTDAAGIVTSASINGADVPIQ